MTWDRMLMGSVMTLGLALATVATAEDESIKPPAVGERIPDFDLPVVGQDNFIELRDQYKQGNVVVVVLRGYPGYQCPLCNRQVSSLVNRAKALAGQAHRIILVYPGDDASLQRRAEQFMGSRKLPPPLVLVRDDGMKMISRWGLRWHNPRETAYPATFVIDRNGRVRWSKISDNHAGRSSVEEVLRELRRL
ncbi:MAG: peroxiredoxin family protein [Pirellulales bacterium]|nr:peroxiredoxin family protein [Pirellulales bacterium]